MTTYYIYQWPFPGQPTYGSAPLALNITNLAGELEAVSQSAAVLAGRYRDLGAIYHKLPFSVRRTRTLDANWHSYCSGAFVVSESAELPGLIQGFGVLEQLIGACWVALAAGDVLLAHRQLAVIGTLHWEANAHIQQLSWAMAQFENQLEYLLRYVWTSSTSNSNSNSNNRSSGGGARGLRVNAHKRMMRNQFLAALPAICGGPRAAAEHDGAAGNREPDGRV